MKNKLITLLIIVIGILMIAGCSAPQCYSPNKVIDKKCCLDENDNGVCDAEEEIVEPEPAEIMEIEVKEEPKIQEPIMPEPKPMPVKPSIQLGEQEIKLGESRMCLEINKIGVYKTSEKRGYVDWMVYTVKNHEGSLITPTVNLIFEGARVENTEKRIGKEYQLDGLDPGMKIIINQSLGIYFEGMDEYKEIEMNMYNRYASPREDICKLGKKFKPKDHLISDKITLYGPE